MAGQEQTPVRIAKPCMIQQSSTAVVFLLQLVFLHEIPRAAGHSMSKAIEDCCYFSRILNPPLAHRYSYAKCGSH